MDLLDYSIYTLITSRYLRHELRTVLLRPAWKRFDADQNRFKLVLDHLEDNQNMIELKRRKSLIPRDKKDTLVLETALSGKAEYLVTGDQDLLTLRKHPRIGKLKIVTVTEFLNQIFYL